MPEKSIMISNGLKNQKKHNGSKNHIFLCRSIVFIRKVLVMVDGSENSDWALDFIFNLAEKFGANVTGLMLMNRRRSTMS
jgi:hypothetical protein